MNQQRWHIWRNINEAPCPAHGVVRVAVPEWNPPDGKVPNGGTVNLEPFIVGQPLNKSTYNEVFGTEYILHGTRPGYNLINDTDYLSMDERGFSVYYAINGDTSVEPGQTGLLTWDLPTWIAIGGRLDPDELGQPVLTPGVGLWNFGAVITVLNDWAAVAVSDPRLLKNNTGCLYLLASHQTLLRAFVGAGIVYSITQRSS